MGEHNKLIPLPQAGAPGWVWGEPKVTQGELCELQTKIFSEGFFVVSSRIYVHISTLKYYHFGFACGYFGRWWHCKEPDVSRTKIRQFKRLWTNSHSIYLAEMFWLNNQCFFQWEIPVISMSISFRWGSSLRNLVHEARKERQAWSMLTIHFFHHTDHWAEQLTQTKVDNRDGTFFHCNPQPGPWTGALGHKMAAMWLCWRRILCWKQQVNDPCQLRVTPLLTKKRHYANWAGSNWGAIDYVVKQWWVKMLKSGKFQLANEGCLFWHFGFFSLI